MVLEITRPKQAAPAVDRASLPVQLWINVADPAQVTPELAERVAGVGLYRTEVLFMEQTEDFPSEEQQYETYKTLFEMCRPDQPVTVRTADIGGDKTLPYFPLGPQENPFLGVRANRVYREHPEILITQMRAILRAAVRQLRPAHHVPDDWKPRRPALYRQAAWRRRCGACGPGIESIRTTSSRAS